MVVFCSVLEFSKASKYFKINFKKLYIMKHALNMH